MNTVSDKNVSPRDVARFDELASQWWDPEAECKPLHLINPHRLRFIEDHVVLYGKEVLDVGCGGGLLSESMASRGACVTGIDQSDAVLEVARLHQVESGYDIDYRCITAEGLSEESAASYDVVTCMELLEHVPDPVSLVRACGRLLKPGGSLFFSTINRTLQAYLMAVIGAEYILKMLPKGTHDYSAFIRPSELDAWCQEAGLHCDDIRGFTWNPLSGTFSLGHDVNVNYILHITS